MENELMNVISRSQGKQTQPRAGLLGKLGL